MLTVLNVAYPFATVGPEAIGGAEQILTAIDLALVREGHRSIVLAPRGSTCAGELRAVEPLEPPFSESRMRAQQRVWRAEIERLLVTEPIDIVHLHGVDFLQYLPATREVPLLATLHLWPNVYPPELYTTRRENLHMVCVSRAQRRACPPSVRPSIIRNGVDLALLKPGDRKDPVVLLLGRICLEKGPHLAIDAAKAAGLSVTIAGAVFPYESHQHYFEWVVAPRLDARARFVGPLGPAAKRERLRAALCLALPSIVPETSSLAAMEALACGTPVVALRSPALEELIEDGRTGFLVGDVDGMRRAFEQVHRLSPADCRRAAEEKCSGEAMTAAYLRLYGELAGIHTLVPARIAQPSVEAGTLG